MARSGKRSWESLWMLAFLATMVLAILAIALSQPSRGVVAALVVVAVALGLLVHWHARTTHYRCPSCGNRFALSPWEDFSHPHGGDKKYVRCPGCGEAGWCEEVPRKPS
jgi:predicted RNA-binding Zn-ribbon protein involved in translation (DUF1610 family)